MCMKKKSCVKLFLVRSYVTEYTPQLEGIEFCLFEYGFYEFKKNACL